MPSALAGSVSTPCGSVPMAALLASNSVPHQKGVVVPARAVNSHSASDGRRQGWPVFFVSQAVQACASLHETLATG